MQALRPAGRVDVKSLDSTAGLPPSALGLPTAHQPRHIRLGHCRSGAAATTSFVYSQSTGQETSKTYADGSKQVLNYNGKLQLTNVYDYGSTAAGGNQALQEALTYNAVGDLTGANYTDNINGSGPAAGACPFGFAGMFQDATTGLYYDNARWYSAPQGRFLTRDPSGEAGGLNLYAYSANDPVNEVDPTGLAGETPVIRSEFHHMAAKGVFDPADKDSTINQLGMKLETGIDIHSAEYGWVTTNINHWDLHSSNNPVGDRWETVQKEWLQLKKEQGVTEITKDMLDAELKRMRMQFGLTTMKDGVEVAVKGEGFFAKQAWKGTTEYYTKLAGDGELIMKNVTAPERLSAKLAEHVSPKLWKQFARLAEKKGVKVVVGIGAVVMAYQGYEEARADGATPAAAVAAGIVEAVNPLPWSTIEIKNAIGDEAADAQKWAEVARQDIADQQIRNLGGDPKSSNAAQQELNDMVRMQH